MNKFVFSFIAIFLIALSTMVTADITRIDFSGEVAYATFPTPPSTFSGSITFDNNATPDDNGYMVDYAINSNFVFDYSSSDYLMNQNYDLTEFGGKSLQIYDNYGTDGYRGSHDLLQLFHYDFESATILEALIQLVDEDEVAFQGFSIPASLNIADFEEAWFELAYSDGNRYRGKITDITIEICPGDSDGDGVSDVEDVCPGGDDAIDSDGDLVPDFCDSCPVDFFNDSDGDSVCGNLDICEGGDDNINTDGDLTPDFCDVCPLDPANDADDDGICESTDNCEVVYNPNQIDSDDDSYGDACDPDIDNDGVLNDDDNCPFDVNAIQEDLDGDGAGDLCDHDVDGDGVIDAVDECLRTLPGDAVDAVGCSIAELCPCDAAWKNHGAYVKCVAHTSEDFVASGQISEAEKDATVSVAGQSVCGQKQ